MNNQKTYVVIDLKSFYASVECVARGLDPMTTNLVVADSSRTEKTICLAVSPSLKQYGLSGRSRLFEVVQTVKKVNSERKLKSTQNKFVGKSYIAPELDENFDLELDYIVAPPQMARYMEVSEQIYNVYKKYVSEEDMIVYSVDEVFLDVTEYLKLYDTTAEELTRKIILDVVNTTGITATAGIGPNLFLCKVALDVEAKKIQADEYGVRIATLTEKSFREKMWSHRPLTDFWRIGKGTEKRLKSVGIYTLGDIAKCSIGAPSSYYNENLLYKLFGINAELLIDHAWGYEPVTVKDVKAYRPSATSLSSGQVLHVPYDYKKTRLIVKEMTDLLSLDLVDKRILTDQVVLTIGYDIENLEDGKTEYKGEVTVDRYGRSTPKHSHGTINLDFPTSSTNLLVNAVTTLYDKIIDKSLTVRRINVVFNRLIREKDVDTNKPQFTQMDLFTDYDKQSKENEQLKACLEKEKSRQQAVISIRKKYGKNAMLKGMNFEEGATTKDRNKQIGGHKA